MKYRASGKEVSVFDGDGVLLVSFTADSPKAAIALRDKAAREGWEIISTKRAKK